MNARIAPENKLHPATLAIVKEMAEKMAQERTEAMQAERDEATIRMVMKAFTVRNNDLYGIGADRATRLIEAVNRDMTTEDPEEVWRHIDTRLEQMGLTFYEKEAY